MDKSKGMASVWLMSAFLAILCFCSFLVLLVDWVSNNHQLSMLGIIGSMLVAVIVTVVFYLYATRQPQAEYPYGLPPEKPLTEKQDEAVEAYLRRLRRMRGEAEMDGLNTALAIVTIAILVFFLVTGRGWGANNVMVLADNGPPSWQPLALGVVGLVLLRRKARR
jgi:Na+/melibiose symporter-like transporter